MLGGLAIFTCEHDLVRQLTVRRLHNPRNGHSLPVTLFDSVSRPAVHFPFDSSDNSSQTLEGSLRAILEQRRGVSNLSVCFRPIAAIRPVVI